MLHGGILVTGEVAGPCLTSADLPTLRTAIWRGSRGASAAADGEGCPVGVGRLDFDPAGAPATILATIVRPLRRRHVCPTINGRPGRVTTPINSIREACH
jgi:hypothetical protein